jgi:hypothetical protein
LILQGFYGNKIEEKLAELDRKTPGSLSDFYSNPKQVPKKKKKKPSRKFHKP